MVSETGQAADDSMIFDPSDEFVSDHDARHALENDVLEMESSVTCEAGLPVEDSGAASEEQERHAAILGNDAPDCSRGSESGRAQKPEAEHWLNKEQVSFKVDCRTGVRGSMPALEAIGNSLRLSSQP